MAPDPVPHPKGAAQRIEATVRALGAAGASVVLVTPDGGRALAGVDHRPVDVGSGGFLERALAFREAAARAVRREAPDVVWFRSPWEGVPLVLSGLPAVYEAHGFPSVELPSHYPALRRSPATLDRLIAEEGLLLHRAGLLVTPSQTGRSFLQMRGVHPSRIRVVPNAVELPPDVAPAVPGVPFVLGYLGTLAPWQGLGTLVEALGRLKGRLQVRLRVVGTRKGPWARELRLLARAAGVRSLVELEGPVEPADVPAFLAACHACVAPLPDDPRNSLQGCCPIKILEYLAAGRAVLASRVRPVEEILTQGETGWLVRPGSPLALAEGILALASRPEEVERLGRNGRALVEAQWGRERFGAAVAGVWGEVSGSRGSLRPHGR